MASNKITTKVELTADDKATPKVRDASREVDKFDGKEATAKLKADTAGIEDAIDALDLPISNFANKLGGLGAKGGVVAAIAGGLLLAADHAADLAIEAENLSTLTGDSVEFASRLGAVWRQSGADAKDLQDVLLQMNGVLSTNAEIAKTLGVNLTDGATIGQRFEQVAEALDKIPDAAKRSQIASQVFGEEGVRQYNALRNSVDDLSEAMENVPDDAVFDEKDVERARKAKREMAELKAELGAFAAAMGSVVIPAVSSLVGGLNDLFDAAESTGQAIRGFFDKGAKKNFEITKELENAEEAARNFDRTLLEGLTTFEEVRAKVLEVTDSHHAASVVALEWKAAQEEVAATTDIGTSAAERHARAMKTMAEEYDPATAAIELKAEADEEAADRAEEHAEAVADLQDWVEGLTDAYGDLKDELSDRSAFLDAQDAFDELAAAAQTSMEAAESGSEDAERAARDHERAIIDLKDKVIAFGESIEGLPPERITSILAQIDAGKFAEAEAMLASLERERTTWLTVRTRSGGTVTVTNDPKDRPGQLLPGGMGAEGGIVTRATRAIIGEAGPEAVIPLHRMPGASPLPDNLGGGVVLNIQPGAIVLQGTNLKPADVVDAFAKYVRQNGPGSLRKLLQVT